MEKVLIFGAGGHGKVILDILLEAKIDVLGFLDEDKEKNGHKISGFKVLGDWAYLENKASLGIALGIGDNYTRERIYKIAKSLRHKIISAIHPMSVVSNDVKFGEGVVIMPGAVVNCGVSLGIGVVVNTSASIDHDCHLGRFCQIWPGAHLAGSVNVGDFSYIGIGASVIQNITIGKKAIIGAGAAVVSDIPDNVTAVGVPAKIIKRK
jgi:sugar O-acyltransferase (sialic acid O-acetyltransferase NeuD family)